MIITETLHRITWFLILCITCLIAALYGFGSEDDLDDLALVSLFLSIVCSLALFNTALQEPYKISDNLEKIMLHEIPESSEFYRYEGGIQNLQYLDDSYTLQTVNIYPDNMVIQFKDEVKKPYMEMQTAESFFGKDLGAYKVKIYLPKSEVIK